MTSCVSFARKSVIAREFLLLLNFYRISKIYFWTDSFQTMSFFLRRPFVGYLMFLRNMRRPHLGMSGGFCNSCLGFTCCCCIFQRISIFLRGFAETSLSPELDMHCSLGLGEGSQPPPKAQLCSGEQERLLGRAVAFWRQDRKILSPHHS